MTVKLLSVLLLVTLLTLSLPATVFATDVEEVDLPEVRLDGGFVNKIVPLMEGKSKIIVDYTKFIITMDTDIREGDGMLVEGAFVDVRADRHHGKLLATRITVLAEATDELRFEGGKITALDLDMGTVVVEGTKLFITADTVLDEGLMVGDFVKVRADRMDHKLIATEIRLIGVGSVLEE
ncbi:MAG: hypothetical protein HYX84_00985 [Chloroflexi bacterium]|nr:hypothetical protein [Chloroflexota bacterium]